MLRQSVIRLFVTPVTNKHQTKIKNKNLTNRLKYVIKVLLTNGERNMQRIVAINKLSKLIGKGFSYRIDDRAVSKDERAEAKVEYEKAREVTRSLEKQMDDRRNAVLGVDKEYNRLVDERNAARKAQSKIGVKAQVDRITVGRANGLFFMVEATGDSWEEVIEKVINKRPS